MKGWWGAFLVVTACQPLPNSERTDAGFAVLTGVRLERIKGAHTTLDIQAPTARVNLDGTRVVMEEPHGMVQDRPDASAVQVSGKVLRANLGRGDVVIEQADARDSLGRTLTAPIIRSVPDAGRIEAEGPVVLSGPNYRMSAAGAVVTPGESLELVGPVEAQAWPRDGGVR